MTETETATTTTTPITAVPSRIFVRGLPPSITDEDFKSHFSKRYNVTDTKLLAKRRIGYVGFRTAEDALSAVKYFNKSFIRMSKIAVELADNSLTIPRAAHPTAKQSLAVAAAKSEERKDDQSTNSLKRKRVEQPLQTKDATKLNEYLGLMTAPSKMKTWRDGELPMLQDPKLKNHDSLDQATPADVSNVDQQPIADESHVKRIKHDAPAQTLEEPVVKAATEEDTTMADLETPPAGASDLDWMRSRTSRLLGLVEDDDEEEDIASTQPKPASPVISDQVSKYKSAPNSEQVEKQEQDVEPLTPAVPHNEPETESVTADVAAIQASGRLFLRNLAYTVTEEELRACFAPFGTLEEVHVSLDPRTGQPKGFAFLQFEMPDEAVDAYQQLDGTVFQGRLLHIIAGSAKRENKLDEFTLSKLPLKKQKQIQKKSEATSSAFSWNSMYMNPDAVMSSIADRLGVSKSEVFDPTSSDAAVKQAQAETHVIQETKAYFAANGVDLEALHSRDRGDTTILVKNFPYGTTVEEIRKLFEEFGKITRVLMPPTGTIAIVELSQVPQGRAAFSALSFRKFKDSILFLEKGPKNLFIGPPSMNDATPTTAAISNTSTADLKQEPEEDVDTSTLFVRNLSFATTNEVFTELFKPLDGFVSARVKTKPDPKKPGNTLSMGFGFLEFRSKEQARAALAAMDGYNLDGHALVIKASHKGLDAATERRKEDQAKKNRDRKSKLIIKNLPFEATKKDVQNLFKSYGQLRAVRLPKKFDNSRKGYAFAEFMTPKEAENAMDALRSTHLLGRRLVIDYAAGDVEDPEKEIERMQQKVGRQVNNVALKKLTTASERKKFNIGGDADEEEA